MIKTQPNEARCAATHVTHGLVLPPCCPMTKNPAEGSSIAISYCPGKFLLEVETLHAYIASYVGGKGDVRSMEGMIQNIAQDCANTIGKTVKVIAKLVLLPTQLMEVECTAHPKIEEPS